MSLSDYRWEYSPLAKAGNYIWEWVVDPALRLFADDGLTAFRRIRGAIQITLLAAILLIPMSLIWKTSHMLTASGLLFDIAGALRLFLLESISESLENFKDRETLPSVAMRELVMPEATGPYNLESPFVSRFYYEKRGVFFLFLGFVLQMIGDLFS